MTAIKSNKHLTFSHNTDVKRHGILRLTPAYSTKLVNEILNFSSESNSLLDPYCGTATTALSGGQRGLKACTMDINPFLIWFGNAKTRNYKKHELALAEEKAKDLLIHLTYDDSNLTMDLPDIFNISRWWNEGSLYVLSEIRNFVDRANLDTNVSDILKLAFCRTIISTSNASFNHQSMSFRDIPSTETFRQAVDNSKRRFLEDLEHIIDALSEDVKLPPQIILADAREVDKHIIHGVDLIITSPPYPNRMSYIRELRPYMYWLDFLKNSQDASDLDWKAIGGTWGSATSKVGKWQAPESYFLPPRLEKTLQLIEDTEEKNSHLLANYIRKYFFDMWLHLSSLPKVMNPRYEMHYIVGNSTYYGIILDVEEIFADMMKELNMGEVTVKTIRKRNSKKELYEYVITARKL